MIESLESVNAPLLTRNPHGRLQEKVALITGGARGIGAATALTFAREGAKVVICDVNEELGLEVATIINNALGNGLPAAIFLPVNVVDATSVSQMVQQSVAQFGQVDILVNNAGVTRDAQLKKMSDEEFDFVIDINLKGVFNCGRAAANQMLEQGKGGVILNAASIVGLDGNFGQTNYAATKAAVVGMTKVWARELGPKGIRVNAVAPGFLETDLSSSLSEANRARIVRRTPLGRLGVPADVVGAIEFLTGPMAAFITGQVVTVDGGSAA